MDGLTLLENDSITGLPCKNITLVILPRLVFTRIISHVSNSKINQNFEESASYILEFLKVVFFCLNTAG